ncbi:GNAT family N-acetyltransferase [Promicromonospora citrea]|uniref:N-acetyltransferase n=1 Tax=Promicromonospora citrea TaxID=43677 RepID=A0A8H9GTP2_9MICO|nr:GNAT family N-acetyltransferase [Promicromonospora citrea]NNH53077.1 GNAT family N-acetyltransferase [Promicromonospora citrea]GGM44164.1 N-acetyltransferase [Promicromonospora citrea]
MPYVVRRASSSDLDRAARVLAAAFDAYPWTRWALPAEGYRERLEEVQRLYLGHAAEHGAVLVDDGVRAVAAFLPPDAPDLAEAVGRRVAELHGQRWASLVALELPALPPQAWVLATVGVDPAHRGAGLGTAVVRAGLKVADEAGAPVGLETSDERNVRLYERLGFATVAVTQVPDGPAVHTMVRG